MVAGWMGLRPNQVKEDQYHASIEKISENKEPKGAEISQG